METGPTNGESADTPDRAPLDHLAEAEADRLAKLFEKLDAILSGAQGDPDERPDVTLATGYTPYPINEISSPLPDVIEAEAAATVRQARKEGKEALKRSDPDVNPDGDVY